MRIMFLTGMVMAAGCSPEVTGEAGSTDTISSDNWWEGDDPSTLDEDEDLEDEEEDEDEDFEDEEEEEDEEDEDEDEEEDEDFEDEEDGAFLWGAVSEDFTAVGFFSFSADSGLLCDMEYVASASPDSSCSACEVAYRLTVGALDFAEGPECATSGYADLSGMTLHVGVSGETLYMKSSGTWGAVPDGFAEAEGRDLFFELDPLEE